jgi:hypothetical protein
VWEKEVLMKIKELLTVVGRYTLVTITQEIDYKPIELYRGESQNVPKRFYDLTINTVYAEQDQSILNGFDAKLEILINQETPLED